MNQECVPLAPNTGVAPGQAYEGGGLVLLVGAILLVAAIVLAIVYRKRLPKLFALLLIPLFIFGAVSFGGITPSVNAQAACEVSETPTPAAIVAEDDVFQSDLPSAANGNNGNNLLKAFVTSTSNGVSVISGINYVAYYVTYANGSADVAAPSITLKLLNNDTAANGLQLDPLSVDLDAVTPGVQQSAIVGPYQLDYNPATDELTVTIVDAQQALEEIIPDQLTVGMPVSEYDPVVNRPVSQRTIVKNFAYTVKDTTGANSATANAVITVVGEAVVTPIPE